MQNENRILRNARTRTMNKTKYRVKNINLDHDTMAPVYAKSILGLARIISVVINMFKNTWMPAQRIK